MKLKFKIISFLILGSLLSCQKENEEYINYEEKMEIVFPQIEDFDYSEIETLEFENIENEFSSSLGLNYYQLNYTGCRDVSQYGVLLAIAAHVIDNGGLAIMCSPYCYAILHPHIEECENGDIRLVFRSNKLSGCFFDGCDEPCLTTVPFASDAGGICWYDIYCGPWYQTSVGSNTVWGQVVPWPLTATFRTCTG